MNLNQLFVEKVLFADNFILFLSTIIRYTLFTKVFFFKYLDIYKSLTPLMCRYNNPGIENLSNKTPGRVVNVL